MLNETLITKNTIVQNCEGTSTDKHPNGLSWIEALNHANHALGEPKKVSQCIVQGHASNDQSQFDIVGAHVHFFGDTQQYIIPMCKAHNAQSPEQYLRLHDYFKMLSKALIIKITTLS